MPYIDIVVMLSPKAQSLLNQARFAELDITFSNIAQSVSNFSRRETTFSAIPLLYGRGSDVLLQVHCSDTEWYKILEMTKKMTAVISSSFGLSCSVLP